MGPEFTGEDPVRGRALVERHDAPFVERAFRTAAVDRFASSATYRTAAYVIAARPATASGPQVRKARASRKASVTSTPSSGSYLRAARSTIASKIVTRAHGTWSIAMSASPMRTVGLTLMIR